MELKAIVEVRLVMNDGESFEEANDRLYDLFFEGLCYNANASCEFWIESTEEM